MLQILSIILFFIFYGAINNCQVITELPIIFSTVEQLSSQTANIQFFEIKQCDYSASGYQYAQLVIISPDSPKMDPTSSFIIIELSTCKDNFNSSCTFITNYLWDIVPTIYTNISWPYQSGNQVIYGRYLGYNRALPFTLMLTYNNVAGVFGGNYDEFAMGSPFSKGADYESLLQYVRTTEMSTVKNNEYYGFMFSFCQYEQPANSLTGYKLTTVVISDPQYPYSAFNIILCAVAEVPNIENCRSTNHYAVKNQGAASLVSIDIDTKHDLSQGVYAVVQGEGGEISLINSFLLSVSAKAI